MAADSKILVVDDFFTMRAIFKKVLKEFGYQQVEEAENGVEAWNLLKYQDFDLVITDWYMPEMSGLELLRLIRQDERLKDLPVIMGTAEAKREYIVEAAELGVNGYIVKPFTVNLLKARWDKIIPIKILHATKAAVPPTAADKK